MLNSSANQNIKSAQARSLVVLQAEAQAVNQKQFRSSFELLLHGLHKTKAWVQSLTFKFQKDFYWLYPDSKPSLETVELTKNNEHIQSALLQHPGFWDRKKARFFVALTPGYQESPVLSDIRHRSPTAIPQLYCAPGTLPLFTALDDTQLTDVNNIPIAAQEYINALEGLIPSLKTVYLAYTRQPSSNIAPEPYTHIYSLLLLLLPVYGL
jgi:hypothetical protein